MFKIFNEITKLWETKTLIIPYAVNLKLDESLDTATVQCIVDNFEIIPPLTKAQLTDDNLTHDFIVSNCTCKDYAQKYMQTIELVEATELLKGYPIDNITFRQPLNPDSLHPKYTTISMIDRILRITPTTKDTAKILINKFTIGNIPTVEAPEFTFTDLTLFDALVQIALYLDCYPHIRFNNYDVDGKMVIDFVELDKKVKSNYTVNNVHIEEMQQPLDNYASDVLSNVSNLSLNRTTYPAMEQGIYVESNDGGYDITNDNAVLRVPHNIKKVVTFEALFAFQADPANRTWFDYTNYIHEYDEWRVFSTAGSDNTRRKDRTAYYKYNTNTFENMKALATSFTDIPAVAEFIGGAFNISDLRGTLFRITYIPIFDTKLSISNGNETPYTVIYNQSGKFIDIEAYAAHLKNYIKRMKEPDILYSKFYRNLNDIPQLGHLVNNEYILTNLSYTKKRRIYEVTMSLSKDYTRRAEYIQAKQDIRTWEIPQDSKSIVRMINQKEELLISLGTPITENNTTSIVDPTKIFNYLLGDTRPIEKIIVANFIHKTGTEYVMFTPVMGVFNDELLINFKTLNNTLIGFSKATNWANNNVSNQVPITYTDAFGWVDNFTWGLVDNFQSTFTEEYEFAANFPLSTPYRNNTLLQTSCINSNTKLLKDAGESINFTYSLRPKGVNGTLTHKETVKAALSTVNNSLSLSFLNAPLEQDEWLTGAKIIAKLPFTQITKMNNGTQIFYSVDKTQIPANYEAIAITMLYEYNGQMINNIVTVSLNNPSASVRSQLSQYGSIYLYFK